MNMDDVISTGNISTAFLFGKEPGWEQGFWNWVGHHQYEALSRYKDSRSELLPKV